LTSTVADDPKKEEDVALIYGASADGDALGVLRKRGDHVEAAVMRKAQEGQPIHGELVKLSPRETPLLYDVEVLHDGRAADAELEPRGRPAQVATKKYRDGWDRLFARKRSAAN
jgi:hypothetical protein